jgi:hypothetical protein
MTKIPKFERYSRIFESNFSEEELDILRNKMNKPKASEKDLIQSMLFKLQDEAFNHQAIEQLDDRDAIHALKTNVVSCKTTSLQ